jgi:hypothetical protein
MGISMRRCVTLVGAIVPLVAGCGDEESEPPPVVEVTCPQFELALPDGSCVRPGIPVDGCGAGFVHDGEYGCEPILPVDVCSAGLVAIPGETACRPVMQCGEGKWGALPVDASTVYVDGSYTAGASDGSASRPWTNISAAVQAAPAGALIAVAEGSYAEQVNLTVKPVRLWGVCPERVEIVGPGVASFCPASAICIAGAGSGSEIGGIALTGGGFGVVMSGANDVVLDRLWVHDAASWGISADSTLGPVAFNVKGSLIEQNEDVGIIIAGSSATIEGTTVRATQPRSADLEGGAGIYAQVQCTQSGCDPNARSNVVLTNSIVENNTQSGLLIGGSDFTVEATVVRGTQPAASDQRHGRGIEAQLTCQGGSCDALTRAHLDLRTSLIERNHDVGLFVTGSDAVVEATVIRETQPAAWDGLRGLGSLVQLARSETTNYPSIRGTALFRNCLVEDNHDVGLAFVAADMTMEGSVVRRTQPAPQGELYGFGISIQTFCEGGGCNPVTRSIGLVRATLVDENQLAGIMVFGSEATIEASVVRATRTRPSDGAYGDGVVVFGDAVMPSKAALHNVWVRDSARAGISNFGSSAALTNTRISCAAFELAGEVFHETPSAFQDSGGNLCGCPVADHTCKAVSGGLAPPSAVETE